MREDASLHETGRHHRGSVRWAAQAAQPDRTPGAGAPCRRELGLVADLATALLEDPAQISLAYQPVHDLRSRTLVGAEALLRWHHPARGAVSPLTPSRPPSGPG